MSFINKDFMLHNKTAKELYFDFAKDMPIYDYHCHLNPQEISENKKYKNITEMWLYGDHYKWRAMRGMGIDENLITNKDTSDKGLFDAFAGTVPYLIGNPLYHWTHLELKRYFDINKTLNLASADEIWDKANDIITNENFCVNSIIEKSNVKVICTTDDPIDSLEHHIAIKNKPAYFAKVLPTFRPDKAINIDREVFLQWISQLGVVCNKNIESYSILLECLKIRIEFFDEVGCRVSDHGLDSLPYAKASIDEVSEIFKKALLGEVLDDLQISKYKTYTLVWLAKEYNALGWTMQLHMNVLRNNNTAMFKLLGADTGFDSINDKPLAYELSHLLSDMEGGGGLPKTILYTLNPKDNYVLGTMLGSFQSSSAKGKIQFGSGWWFNDQRDGMVDQMKSLSNLGILANFVGMITDSRSFLSYTRHEYFRRILCNLIGEWVEMGEYPKDMNMLEKIIKGICFDNAVNYFGIEL